MKEFLSTKTILVLLLGIVCNKLVFSQGGNDFINDIKKVVPASPDAAALGKYGEIPVSMNTGTPNISIPLYTFQGNDLSLPISLSYHGSGFRVSEVSSWVGLGWVLNAGGVISRTVRGWPDDRSGGYFESYNDYLEYYQDSPCIDDNPSSAPCSWRIRVSNGELDMESDVFSFNFNGYSGRIQFDHNKVPKIIPHQDLKIEYHPFIGTGINDRWVIITPDGAKYIFEETEVSSFRYGGSYTAAWYLTDIISSKSYENIHFSYSSDEQQWSERISTLPFYVELVPRNSDLQPNICSYAELTPEAELTYSTKHLDSISCFPYNLVITINTADDRQDVGGESSDRRLTDLIVRRFSNIIASNSFNNNLYFTGNDNVGSLTYLNKRLKLQSVHDNLKNRDYVFEYNESYRMPSYESPDIDHWGFYNDADNHSFIPDPGPEFDAEFIPSSLTTADRSTDLLATQACMLTKITYPTGGYTNFVWEPHEKIEHYSESVEVYMGTANNNGTVYMTENEEQFANYLHSLYVDDPAMPVNIKADPFITTESRNITFTVSKNLGSPGFCRAYLAKVLNKDDNPEHLRLPEYDIFNECWRTNCEIYDGMEINLEKGAYFIVTIVSRFPNDLSIYVSGKYTRVNSYYGPRYAGGVRIKQITDHDGINHSNDITRNYNYYNNNLEYPGINNYSYRDPCKNKMILTSSLVGQYGIPLRFDGSHVGYGQVSETYSGGQNGKRVIKYRNSGIPEYRGLVEEEYLYDKDLKKVKHTINTYSGYTFGDNIYGKIIKLVKAERNCSGSGCLNDLEFYDPSPFSNNPLWFGLTSTVDTIFGMSGSEYVSNVSTFSYGGAVTGRHTLLTQKADLSSDGTSQIHKYKYPPDYTSSANILNSMQDKNMINEPVEIQLWKNDKLISARYNKYKLFSNHIALHESYRLELEQPLTSTGFIGLDQYGNLPANSHYRKYLTNDYNASGLLISQQKTEDIPVVYIWGYNNTYPVAKIENLQSASISESLGNLLNQLDDYSILTSAEDRIALKAINNNIRNSLPANAMITTYTFSPLVGMTSQTDAKGTTLYYGYDSVNRLKEVRDDDGNLLKTYDYHYKE